MTDAGSMTHDQALQLCLNEVEAGTSLPLEPGIRLQLEKGSAAKFQANHHLWPKYHARVVHAARFIGVFATAYAQFDNAQAVSEKHARDAVAAVKRICTAVKDDPKLQWCPDFPGAPEP